MTAKFLLYAATFIVVAATSLAEDYCAGGQDVLTYFNKTDPEDLTWEYVKSARQFRTAVIRGRHMISAVVHLNETNLTIGNSTDFYLKELLDTTISYNYLGLRLHFADTAAFDAAMEDAEVYDLFSTMERRDAALGTAARTYLVNAAYLQNSWEDLNEQLLSGEGENNTITLWAEQSELKSIDFVQLNKFLEEHKDKIFYGIPEPRGGGANSLGFNVFLILFIPSLLILA